MVVIPLKTEDQKEKEYARELLKKVITSKDQLVEAELNLVAAQNAYDKAARICDSKCLAAAQQLFPGTYVITFKGYRRKLKLRAIFGAPARTAVEMEVDDEIVL